MLCENCGSNVDGMKFCKNCGKKVENASAEKVIMPTTTNGDKPTNTPKSDLKTMGYIFVFWPLAASLFPQSGQKLGGRLYTVSLLSIF